MTKEGDGRKGYEMRKKVEDRIGEKEGWLMEDDNVEGKRSVRVDL